MNTPFSLPDNESAEPGNGGKGQDQQQKIDILRACQSCRASKVRCDQPNPGKPCLRCQKSGKPCIDATSQPEKRQRQLNDRILEIQSRIELMLSNAELQDSAGDTPPSSGNTLRSPSESSRNTQQHDRNLLINGNHGMEDLESTIHSWLAENITDLDDRTAETILGRYLSNMAPTFPVVVFAPGTTAADVRSQNPLLFLAILDVASSGFCALETQRKLRKLIVQAYVHCMLRTEQYTIGLLQALIVSATWYRTIEPVEPGEQMDIYQISHTAANMALIMRLGESLNSKFGGSFQAESLEARRVWLGCHYICSNTSMSLRAPNIMRWTRLMDECLEVLETSPAALASDKVLCRHIRLQHITEDFAMQLSAEETSSPRTTRAIQIQMTHHDFKRRLNEWRMDVADGCWDVALEFSYYFSLLYMNEVAYCTPMSDNVTCEATVAIETQAILEFMETTDDIFRVFTSLDMSTIRALPAMYLIRIIYTFVILVKLRFAAAKLPTYDARLQVARLQVPQRLDRLIQMSAGWGPLWPATKLATVFSRLRSWFESGDGNPQRLQKVPVWLTLWEFKSPSQQNRDAHDMDMAETPSDVDTTPLSLELPVSSDFSTGPPFRSMSQAPESCVPQKEATAFMHDDKGPLDAVDIPNIEQMDDTAFMGLDWSQVSDMGFDLGNLDMPCSPIPIPSHGSDPDTLYE
ncbi:uncharacterized protein P174DRAFT_418256 [Aspergillus novofumigatus IBT 16806]|uniref:Putative Zn(II)2Cys6 transcription factor n=1 Tax=Aspergillus novofumigatus (strain IBT 16806) TaxID=1392255 RepID=A0A2I1CI33_ASPN1|nr:putative Zn(II)2Cys6 transcription factor [Aspergillus novofumigatus IBT 16806]PKX97285.1 putative Zn(II)2Cys6 transcription factor [Aspergillus novofumigatus IBT 16806]